MSGKLMNREDCVYAAKLLDDAECHNDMIQVVNDLAALHINMTKEERNLFSIAYKNKIQRFRTSLSSLADLQRIEEHNRRDISRIVKYRQQVEAELKETCLNVLSILSNDIIPFISSSECFIFFYKMMADYNRYLAEFSSGAERLKYANEALVSYQTASERAYSDLVGAHPVRLALGLNYSVFYHDILKETDKACDIAKDAFDAALCLSGISDEDDKDSAVILHLLRDNLTLWTNEDTETEQLKELKLEDVDADQLEVADLY